MLAFFKHLWKRGKRSSTVRNLIQRFLLRKVPPPPINKYYTQNTNWKPEYDTLYSMKGKDLHGEEYDFSQHKDKVSLIVNVACNCGYTKGSYKELTKMYKELRDKGFIIFGFPSNQFNSQESGTPDEISQITKEKYGVEFPLQQKGDVNGENEQPIYTWLKKSLPGDITWNFSTKFLIDKRGVPVARFEQESWETIRNAVSISL